MPEKTLTIILKYSSCGEEIQTDLFSVEARNSSWRSLSSKAFKLLLMNTTGNTGTCSLPLRLQQNAVSHCLKTSPGYRSTAPSPCQLPNPSDRLRDEGPVRHGGHWLWGSIRGRGAHGIWHQPDLVLIEQHGTIHAASSRGMRTTRGHVLRGEDRKMSGKRQEAYMFPLVNRTHVRDYFWVAEREKQGMVSRIVKINSLIASSIFLFCPSLSPWM